MTLRRFKQLVRKALEDLPAPLRNKLENVIIEVRPRPTPGEMREMRVGRGSVLLGLYQGVPLVERPHDFGGAMPDRITIFQEPIEEECSSDEEIEQSLRTTLIHELGHYFFNLNDDQLRKMGLG